MPILGLPTRTASIGDIRIGLPKGHAANTTNHVAKLSTLRFTSPVEHMIKAIASLYGGEPTRWQHPNRGPQWEVITSATDIPVMVPRQLIDPWYELWGQTEGKNGRKSPVGCLRRCDGQHEVIRNTECLCDPHKRECKPHTRWVLGLAQLQGTGVWTCRSTGMNAAAEMSGELADWVAKIPHGVRVPARLTLTERSSTEMNERGELVPQKYGVLVVSFDEVTSTDFGDAGRLAAIETAAAAPARQALPAGTGDNTDFTVSLYRDAISATSRDQLADIWRRAGQGGVEDKSLETLLKQRAATFPADPARPTSGAGSGATPPTPEQPAQRQAEPQQDDNPDARMAALQTLMATAGQAGLATSNVAKLLGDRHGVTIQTATTGQLAELTTMLREGTRP